MQLNITTDYAIRMLNALGDGSVKTLDEISRECQISKAYLGKLVRLLKEKEILGSIVGIKGGVFLKKPLEDISFNEVFSITEPTMKINRCLEDDSYCSSGRADACPVRNYYQYIQEKLEKEYFTATLAQVVRGQWRPETGCGGREDPPELQNPAEDNMEVRDNEKVS